MSGRGKRAAGTRDEEEGLCEDNNTEQPPKKYTKPDSSSTVDTDDIVVCEVSYSFTYTVVKSVDSVFSFLGLKDFCIWWCSWGGIGKCQWGTLEGRLTLIFASFIAKMASFFLGRKVLTLLYFSFLFLVLLVVLFTLMVFWIFGLRYLIVMLGFLFFFGPNNLSRRFLLLYFAHFMGFFL